MTRQRVLQNIDRLPDEGPRLLVLDIETLPMSANAWGLWAGIMRGEAEAWDEMEKYNVQDILSTEALYLALRPWAKGLPNLAHFYKDDFVRCPRCGGKHLEEAGVVSLAVGEYKQWRCRKCGGLSRGRSMINSKEKRNGILAI